ncbi:MAG: hypothetical protein LBT34_03605 [Clostridiales Family XIII bacterium]|jgi:hypothetical protein|nr:hypothetical protein [Clostridiales Family XIII bacterium]
MKNAARCAAEKHPAAVLTAAAALKLLWFYSFAGVRYNFVFVWLLTCFFVWLLFSSFRNKWISASVYFAFSVLMFADLTYSSFFNKYLSLNMIGAAGVLGEIKASILTVLRPEFFLTLADAALIFALLAAGVFSRRRDTGVLKTAAAEAALAPAAGEDVRQEDVKVFESESSADDAPFKTDESAQESNSVSEVQPATPEAVERVDEGVREGIDASEVPPEPETAPVMEPAPVESDLFENLFEDYVPLSISDISAEAEGAEILEYGAGIIGRQEKNFQRRRKLRAKRLKFLISVLILIAILLLIWKNPFHFTVFTSMSDSVTYACRIDERPDKSGMTREIYETRTGA